MRNPRTELTIIKAFPDCLEFWCRGEPHCVKNELIHVFNHQLPSISRGCDQWCTQICSQSHEKVCSSESTAEIHWLLIGAICIASKESRHWIRSLELCKGLTKAVNIFHGRARLEKLVLKTGSDDGTEPIRKSRTRGTDRMIEHRKWAVVCTGKESFICFTFAGPSFGAKKGGGLLQESKIHERVNVYH
jgi:hypothetical protein